MVRCSFFLLHATLMKKTNLYDKMPQICHLFGQFNVQYLIKSQSFSLGTSIVPICASLCLGFAMAAGIPAVAVKASSADCWMNTILLARLISQLQSWHSAHCHAPESVGSLQILRCCTMLNLSTQRVGLGFRGASSASGFLQIKVRNQLSRDTQEELFQGTCYCSLYHLHLFFR